MSFSIKDRADSIKKMGLDTFDLCIVGGGITGSGVARDAASRGMRVCLIEQGDFASGTSSRSSKLIHGGIRYLENLEFGLVFEALNERHVLFEIAPHLVHPLTFMLPVYRGGRVGMFKMGLGMWLYDALALFHAPRFHERLSPKTTTSRLPSLQEQGLEGSYLYSDAYMDDDRLVIETLRSARRYGAEAANYVRAGKGGLDGNNKLESIEAEDLLTGQKIKIKAKHFVSTVGPWTDLFATKLFEWKPILRPTKGIHLTLRRDRLPLEDAVVMATDSDKRIVFAIPRHEMIIIGTTDTDYKGDPADVHTERADVEYLLKVIGNYFPHAKITEKDIVASYSGVRPLVDDGSQTEGKTSREHVVLPTNHNMTFVAGGKYTTYRRMARDIVETVLKNEFSIEKRVEYARNQTREVINPHVTPTRLTEALSQSILWAAEFGLTEKETQVLAERHGFEALDILEKGEDAGLHTPWEMEALFAIRETMCLHLRDFMLRRSPLFLSRTDHGRGLVEKIAAVFAKELDWNASKITEEKALYDEHFKFELGWMNKIH